MMDNVTRSGVSAIVEYDYTATEPDELNLVKGAIIHSIKIQSGGWWEGSLTSGKTGMFPDNFVRVLDPDDKNPVVLREKSATLNRRCKAVYSYAQNNNDELTLAVGDVIEFLGEVEEGWWRGKLGSRVGVFPSNFVISIESLSPILVNRRSNNVTMNKIKSNLSNSREDLVSSNLGGSLSHLEKDAPILPPKPVRELCKVLFPYPPSNEDELELKEGDIITILTKELPDKGWWKGELKGKIGVFPDNFVVSLSPEASPTKEGHNSHKPDRPATTKVSINSKSSNRKDSFGSKDSLNDSGIITGNVAAYRKSLENKVVDTTIEKSSRKSFDTKISSDFRKSLESLDDKKSTPPPVLSKKPVVPVKKSPTVSSVAGNLFSGLKQIVKNEHKLSSNDSLDGIGSSKSTSNVADNNEKGIIGEKIKRDSSDFDQVERGSILPDMRASRAKAPKRRLPTTSMNIAGENNNSVYQNGGNGFTDSLFDVKSESLDDDIAKPKPKNWEKQKAPWMDELKASQAKKTSPNENNKTYDHEINEKFDMSKSFSSSYVSSHKKSIDTTNFEVRSSSVDIKTSSIDTIYKKDGENVMAKSMSLVTPKVPITEVQAVDDHIKIRSTSVNLLNRSISPVGRIATKSLPAVSPEVTKTNTNDLPVTGENVCCRVTELEQKVLKLEKLVQFQNQTIEELLKSVKDESERVKALKGELDKYAQCVTQV